MTKGKIPLALTSFDKAIAASPSDKEVRMTVIALLVQEEMYRESLRYLQEAIAVRDPRQDITYRSALYTTLGDAHWKLGNQAEAVKAYEQAIRLNPYNATA